MNAVISIIKSITPTTLPKYLGRWRIDYCKVKINNTIDLANEDHCGTCGQYALNKINLGNNLTDNKKSLDKKV
jgi:hypothetical protein